MESSEIFLLLGRILYGGFFVMSGVNHFKNLGMMSGYAGSKGVPSPKLAVGATGLLLLLGGLGILLGVYVQVAVFLLALFLIPTSFIMHAFWKDTDPNMMMANRVNFMKNIALLGAALMFLAIPGPWAYSAF